MAAKLKGVAVHESGHAVVAIALGFDLEMISIRDARSNYRAGESLAAEPENPSEKVRGDYCVYLCGGWAAEIELLGRAAFGEDYDDFALVEELGKGLRLDDWKNRARDIVRLYRNDVSRLADRLATARQLRFLEIMVAFGDDLRGLYMSRLPPEDAASLTLLIEHHARRAADGQQRITGR